MNIQLYALILFLDLTFSVNLNLNLYFYFVSHIYDYFVTTYLIIFSFHNLSHNNEKKVFQNFQKIEKFQIEIMT